MKIGIHATNHRRDGGQFQFLASVLDALFADAPQHQFVLFHQFDGGGLARRYTRENWRWIALPRPRAAGVGPVLGPLAIAGARRILRPLGLELTPLHRPAPADSGHAARAVVAAHAPDLMLFPTWTEGCWNWGVPYVCFVHDLQHRLQPEFAEVSLFGKWGQREAFFGPALAHARLVVADSGIGSAQVSTFYGVPAERIRVLPYTVPPPGPDATAAPPAGMPERFFLYPAQFWPHKNHYRVVEAVGLLHNCEGVDVHVVFPGGGADEWGVREMCAALAAANGVARQVHFPGYLSDAALATLYRRAEGLVMPTYFGPTNIPYLEAFRHRCPVIASDLPGIREQVGDAALRVDPRDSAAIAQAMKRLWLDAPLREKLARAGSERLEAFGPARFRDTLLAIVEDACLP